MSKLLTVPEVAELTKFSKSTIYKMVEKKQIPHVKINSAIRFLDAQINSFLNSKIKHQKSSLEI